jgi:hypothetical protein
VLCPTPPLYPCPAHQSAPGWRAGRQQPQSCGRIQCGQASRQASRQDRHEHKNCGAERRNGLNPSTAEGVKPSTIISIYSTSTIMMSCNMCTSRHR